MKTAPLVFGALILSLIGAVGHFVIGPMPNWTAGSLVLLFMA